MLRQIDSTDNNTKGHSLRADNNNARPLGTALETPCTTNTTNTTNTPNSTPDSTTQNPTRPKTPFAPIPTGAFEIEPDGTILHFRPYDANGKSIDELEGCNLYDDVIRSSSARDADYFLQCVERGEVYKASRHLLQGRDLTLVLLFHADTNTYWGFLGPA